jgi:hypothetical protein
MSTYRARREAKAERLDGWAELRQQRAAADAASEPDYVHDWAWITQPGLDRSKENRRHERRWESLDKADRMHARADGIRAQLDGSIYDDDPDAIEQLEAKLAALEAKRETVKAHNKEMRRPGACDHPSNCDCRSYYPRNCSCKRHPVPAYVLQNLGGNIKRTRDRIEGLKRLQIIHSAPIVAEAERDDDGTHRITERREEIEYPGKPSAEVRTAIKAQGYRWDRVAMVWWRRLQAP